METRKPHQTKSSPLPVDYVKMVKEVFSTNFHASLEKFAKAAPGQPPHFDVSGRIYATEIVLYVSIVRKDELAATTVLASSDYDSQASSPTIQDILGACVDAAGSIFSQLFAPENEAASLEGLASKSLSAFENVPFEWTLLEVERHRIHLKMDKSNPSLDVLAEDWLAKNDPEHQLREQLESEETEKLFVTGPKKGTTQH